VRGSGQWEHLSPSWWSMALGVWQRSEVTTSFAGKRIYIIGLGARGTGRACAQVLAARGAQCTLADINPSSALSSELELLAGHSCHLELGDQAYATIEQADLVVVSPGVPRRSNRFNECAPRAFRSGRRSRLRTNCAPRRLWR